MRKVDLNDYLKAAIVEYYVRSKSTIRKTAKAFNIPKSSVHRVLADRTGDLSYFGGKRMLSRVTKLIEKNKKEAHVRGGMATKAKFLALRKKK